VVELIKRTPDEVIFHRLTGTASSNLLLAPEWCSKKWLVLNRITAALDQREKWIDMHNYQKDVPALLWASGLVCPTV
jgi:radical SAM superfamily enzyme